MLNSREGRGKRLQSSSFISVQSRPMRQTARGPHARRSTQKRRCERQRAPCTVAARTVPVLWRAMARRRGMWKIGLCHRQWSAGWQTYMGEKKGEVHAWSGGSAGCAPLTAGIYRPSSSQMVLSFSVFEFESCRSHAKHTRRPKIAFFVKPAAFASPNSDTVSRAEDAMLAASAESAAISVARSVSSAARLAAATGDREDGRCSNARSCALQAASRALLRTSTNSRHQRMQRWSAERRTAGRLSVVANIQRSAAAS